MGGGAAGPHCGALIIIYHCQARQYVSSVRIYNYWHWEKPHYTIVPDHNDPMPVNAEMGHLKPPGASLVRSMDGREAWLLLGDFSIKLFNVSLWFYCHTKLAKSHDMIRFTTIIFNIQQTPQINI